MDFGNIMEDNREKLNCFSPYFLPMYDACFAVLF